MSEAFSIFFCYARRHDTSVNIFYIYIPEFLGITTTSKETPPEPTTRCQ